MSRGWALGLGLVVGVAAAWLSGLAFNPLAGSEDASDDLGALEEKQRIEDEIRELNNELADLKRRRAEGPLALEGHGSNRPGAEDATPKPANGTPAPQPPAMRNRWSKVPLIPKDLPKALRGTPEMWITALRAALKRGDGTLTHYFTMALVAVGRDAADPLRTILLDGNESAGMRGHALTALRSIAPDMMGEVAEALLSDRDLDGGLRTHALHALAGSQPTSAPQIVREIAADDQVPLNERQAAWTVLMHADPDDFIGQMRDVLRAGSAAEKDIAYRVLSRANRKELKGFLTETMEEAPPNKQRQLIQAIARMKGPGWGDAQMTGPPDTPVGGDNQTAWASKQAQEGLVTVELDFPIEVTPEQVRVHETFNPGAIVKVEARTSGGDHVTLWTGEAGPAGSIRWFVPSLEQLDDRVRTIRLTLDTDKVKGWNEIDAVELVGDGRRQWASAARSSSCYARR